ncbi:SDR family oxidoreductase [Bradyrhizobium liaoningense]|uniref:SDR family oxidoreductase n=1 Tax=Bradyrhizobium liaoningense TaxID=43992 RepID=UPI001BA6C5C2|nr:SDR family oxidoreductase [Bradyrhizobium liaoningense]MBR0717353.1 SDR family oxidoreductase [Bradyrhizobium liaoningense]
MERARRVVIITGAAGGVGRALLEGFHRDGDIIAAVDLPGTDVVEVTAALGADHAGFHCDVASEDEVVSLVAAIEQRFGRIDVLVNNAALGPTMAATTDTDVISFRKALSVNLRGPFVLAREAAKRMTGRGGVIVNIASLAGVLGNPKRNAYAASKAGLISATRSLACEWAKHGIRVVAVAPGYVRTPMVAELERSGKANLDLVRRRIPLGRMGRPDEIAAAARFLASPAAGYVTGAVLAVDGGWQSFNQPGDAHPPVAGTPDAELAKPEPAPKERIVVVTGGANGIGAAIAQRFASAGDTVVVADKDGDRVAELVRALGTKHMAFSLNVSLERQVLALFAAIRQRFGRVDVLVNDAAVADSCVPALDQSAADLDKVLEVNVVGAFLCAREAIKLMGSGGVILNLGSINTFLPFAPRHAYGASKAAIDILTRCMAAELGPAGIRTATIAPGYIRTPGVAALQASGRIESARIRRRVPLGRFGEPAEVANAAYFLASPEASYVNGSILYVDGGWTSFGDAGDASTVND